MYNTFKEVMNQKTIDQYKIIEDRYLTLKRYLRLYCEKHTLVSREEIEMIIEALEDRTIGAIRLYEPTEEEKEKENE